MLSLLKVTRRSFGGGKLEADKDAADEHGATALFFFSSWTREVWNWFHFFLETGAEKRCSRSDESGKTPHVRINGLLNQAFVDSQAICDGTTARWIGVPVSTASCERQCCPRYKTNAAQGEEIMLRLPQLRMVCLPRQIQQASFALRFNRNASSLWDLVRQVGRPRARLRGSGLDDSMCTCLWRICKGLGFHWRLWTRGPHPCPTCCDKRPNSICLPTVVLSCSPSSHHTSHPVVGFLKNRPAPIAPLFPLPQTHLDWSVAPCLVGLTCIEWCPLVQVWTHTHTHTPGTPSGLIRTVSIGVSRRKRRKADPDPPGRVVGSGARGGVLRRVVN